MSDELYPIYKILQDAFPDHRLSEHQYWRILVLLYPELSDRQLAKVMSCISGRDCHMIYNDIAKASTLDYTGDKEFEAVKETLIRQGLAQWLKESG